MAAWNFILRFRPCLSPSPSSPCVPRFRPCPTIHDLSQLNAIVPLISSIIAKSVDETGRIHPLPFASLPPSLSVNIYRIRVCVCVCVYVQGTWTKRRWIKKGRLLIVDRICMGNRRLTGVCVVGYF